MRALETTARCRRGATGQSPAVVAELARTGAELDRVLGLPEWCPVPLDLDSTTAEAQGELKDRTPDNYQGELRFGSLFRTWAERRRVLADGLRPGIASDRSISPQLVLQAVRARPEEHGEVRLRGTADSPAPSCLTSAGATGCGSGWRPTTKSCGTCGRISCPPAGGQAGRWRGCGHPPLAGGTSGCGFRCGRYGTEAKDISQSPESRRRKGIPSVNGDWP